MGCFVVTVSVALAPAYTPEGCPVTPTTIGNVTTPELLVGTLLTEVTVPATDATAPAGVIATDCPFLTSLISVSSTVASTTKDFDDWISTSLLESVDEESSAFAPLESP